MTQSQILARGPAPRYPIPKKSRIKGKQDSTAKTATG